MFKKSEGLWPLDQRNLFALSSCVRAVAGGNINRQNNKQSAESAYTIP